MWVEIHELNEQGFYSPVELLQREGQEAGGVFMLRQGFSRRIVVQFVVPKHGNLPVVIETIPTMAIGSVVNRIKGQKGLDSYQERDLQTLRDRFSNSVMKRREYLDQQIQEMINKPNKSQADKEHEGMLIDQWVSLTEERNSILCPQAGSGVPGAIIDWNPLPGMESHIPTIFLDLDDNALSGCADIDSEPAGSRSFLSFEQSQNILELPLLKYDQKRVTATASWDSSIHDSVLLNRVTQPNERVYLILKVVVRLSSPALVNVVLRKRICVRIYKRPSLKDSLRKRFWRQTNIPTRCGLTLELISHIPRQSGEQSEERETLAQKAAQAMHIAGEGEELMDGEAIEKYNKGISHVENILNLHKLRQEVLVKEKLAAVGRSSKSLTARNMRKFASTPNLFNAPSMSNLWRTSNNFPSNSDMQSEAGGTPVNPEYARLQSAEGRRSPLTRVSTGGEPYMRHTKRARPYVNENRHSFYGFENLQVMGMNNEGLQSSSSDSDNSQEMLGAPSTQIRTSPSTIHQSNSTHGVSNLQPLVETDTPPSPLSPLAPSDQYREDVRRTLSNEFELTSNPNNLPSMPVSLEEQINLEKARSLKEELLRQQAQKGLSLEEQGVKSEIPVLSEDSVPKSPSSVSPERRNSSPAQPSSPRERSLRVGDIVSFGEDKSGQVRFYGRTQFADGIWVGMELNVPEGKNDGSVSGVQYFTSKPNHGLFIRADKLSKTDVTS